MTHTPGLVGQAEVERATAVLEAWDVDGASPALELRGLIAAALADAYTDGYVAGVRRGRQEAAQLVTNALRDEGLL